MKQVQTSTQIPMEHERRFFPNLATFTFDKNLYPSKLITQAYLEDALRTRIRDEFDPLSGHVYLQTRKTGEGVSRTEDEHEITEQEYELMLQNTTCQLVKRRYFLPCGKYIAEINFFEGDLEGYVQIEVEFTTAFEAESFIPPEWFGVEVTDDSRHGNYSLAKFGCKELLS